MSQPTVELLLQRLERVERTNRRLQCAGGILVLALAGGLLMGQAVGQERVSASTVVAQTIEANRVLVRDATGKVRAFIESESTGPVTFTLSDKDGRERLTLGVGPAGGVGVIFRDKEGTVRAGMGVAPGGRPYLVPKRLNIARDGETP
jgi:hypothetical protein